MSPFFGSNTQSTRKFNQQRSAVRLAPNNSPIIDPVDFNPTNNEKAKSNDASERHANVLQFLSIRYESVRSQTPPIQQVVAESEDSTLTHSKELDFATNDKVLVLERKPSLMSKLGSVKIDRWHMLPGLKVLGRKRGTGKKEAC
jgi:hypothetical protein